MTRTAALLLACLLAAASAGAQAVAVPPASQLSGTVGLAVGESNLLGSAYYPDVPGLSSTFSLAALSLKFSDGASQSYIDATQYLESFRASTRVGYEAGVSLDAANLFAFVPNASRISDDANSSYYSYLQPMIDWYANNAGRFGMTAYPGGASSWPTTAYGSSAGRYRFIYGDTVEPAAWVAWTQAKWTDARALYLDLKEEILTAIEAISPDYSSGSGTHVNQYVYQGLSESKKALVLAEQRAYDEFIAVIGGVDVKASLSGPNLRGAYVKVVNIAGILDMRVDFLGSRLSVGTLLSSARAGQPSTGPSLALALPVGLVPGLGLSLSADLVGGTSSTAENYDTQTMEYWNGDPAWMGVKLASSYAFGDILGLDFSLLWPDAIQRPLTMAGSLSGRLALDGELGARVALEVDGLYWQDRYDADAAPVLAYAGGLDSSVTWFGATPHALALYKSAGYYGTGGNLRDDRFYGLDLRNDFNAAKAKDALALDGGLGFDPVLLLGMRLASIDGGYRLLMYGLDSGTVLAQGWYAALKLDFEDLANLPLNVSLSVGNYKNWGPYASSFADFSTAPVAGLLTGLSWTAVATLTPADEIQFSLEAAGRDSDYRMDTAQIVSVAIKAVIKF